MSTGVPSLVCGNPQDCVTANFVYPPGSTHAPDGLPVIVWEEPGDGLVASSFWYFHVHVDFGGDDMMSRLANDCLLVKCILDIWGEGLTLLETQEMVGKYDPEVKRLYSGEDQSFKFVIDGWGTAISHDEKLAIIDSFEQYTGFKGPIRMKDPMHLYWVIIARPSKHSTVPGRRPWYAFGRQVGVNEARGPLLQKYDLKKRRYLGPTTMDSELAFIMCTLCSVRKSSFVVDPFVGTGGLLVPAAARGAITFGMDIDMRVIKIGKKDRQGNAVNVWTNFKDYNLASPVGLVRADIDRNPFRAGLTDMFDVILADPPYGVRAGGRKSKSDPNSKITDRDTHIPSTAPYPLAECLMDLLEWSAKVLVIGGRLGYWLPCLPASSEDELPRHPMLKMKYNCEQVLGRYSRRLVIMEKIRHHDPLEVDRYFRDNPMPEKMAIDELWDVVYAPADPSQEKKPIFRSKTV